MSESLLGKVEILPELKRSPTQGLQMCAEPLTPCASPCRWLLFKTNASTHLLKRNRENRNMITSLLLFHKTTERKIPTRLSSASSSWLLVFYVSGGHIWFFKRPKNKHKLHVLSPLFARTVTFDSKSVGRRSLTIGCLGNVLRFAACKLCLAGLAWFISFDKRSLLNKVTTHPLQNTP